jgi:hypothetical protein
MSLLIALVGQKGVGKTTIAHHLVTNGFIEVSFADTLKESLSLLLGIPRSAFDNPASKETPFEVGGHSMTPRQMMQAYGDLVKSLFGETVLIDAVRRRIDAIDSGGGMGIVISDVRFPSEAKFAQRLGARIYRVVPAQIVRIVQQHLSIILPGLLDTNLVGLDTHSSESLQHQIQCDAVIENDGENLDALHSALDAEFRIVHPIENACVQCGIELGPCNPRQLCGKTACDYDYS